MTDVLVDEDFRTEDIGEAEALIGRVYSRGRIDESASPFHFRQRVRGDQGAVLARFEISSYAAVTAEYGDVAGIGMLTGGRYRTTTNGVEVDTSRPFLIRPGEARSWSQDLDLTMFNLTPAGLETMAGYAPGSLRLPSVAPISSSASASWITVAQYAAGVFRNDDLLRNELIRKAVIDTLFATALATFSSAGRRSGLERHYPAPRSIQLAVRFIEEHAAEPIGVIEIAAAAGLSHRGLHAAFRRDLGTTPGGLLRDVRLERARAALLDADPTTSVGEVARRWGYAHLGRFAAHYRTRFGELPSVTLRTRHRSFRADPAFPTRSSEFAGASCGRGIECPRILLEARIGGFDAFSPVDIVSA